MLQDQNVSMATYHFNGDRVKKFKKRILIANRGEIALRIIRSAKEMDIETVAIYSEEDVDSPHRFMADYSYPLKGRSSTESYLDIKQVIAAMQAGSRLKRFTLVMVSWLNQPNLLKHVKTNGFVFMGPSADILELMGDKISAKIS